MKILAIKKMILIRRKEISKTLMMKKMNWMPHPQMMMMKKQECGKRHLKLTMTLNHMVDNFVNP